jgi:hypothetical protein
MLLRTNGLPVGHGYLEIDHRRGGPAPDGLPQHFEADTYTCTHCSYVVILNPARIRERYKCKACSHHICDNCAAQMKSGGTCLTMNQRYERHLEALNSSIPLDDSGHLA